MNFYPFFFFLSLKILDQYVASAHGYIHHLNSVVRWSGGSIQLDFFVHFLTSNSVAKKPPIVQGIDWGMNCVEHVSLEHA